MGTESEALASQGATSEDPDQLPSYAEASAASFAEAESSASASASIATPGLEQPSGGQHQPAAVGPTVASPFDFPSQADSPPIYSAAEHLHHHHHHQTSNDPIIHHKPIAIPQAQATATSGFLAAYAAPLLAYGIPRSSWRSFLETTSAFLQARGVSDRALGHAADIGRDLGGDLGSVPRGFGRSVASHARSIGRRVGDSARRGDLVGAARGVIGGTIALPVTTALGAVSASLRLTGSVAEAATRRPLTPAERARAYVAVANRDWFWPRGLEARLLDTAQLGELVGVGAGAGVGDGGSSSSGSGNGNERSVSANRLVEVAKSVKDSSAERQLSALGAYIGELEVLQSAATLELGIKSLWLVVLQKETQK